MKRILLLSLTFLFCLNLTAQDIDAAKALQLVSRNLPAAGLTLEDLSNAQVSNAYHDRTSGLDLVYLQQRYKGLPVFNQLQVMAFQQGKLVSNTGGRLANPDRLSHQAAEIASVDPGVAVRSALASKKLSADFFTSPIVLQQGRKYDFGKPLNFHESITAELMWVPIKDGAELVLAWQVYLVPKTSSDYWLIRVDAHRNKVVDENNLTVYCKFHS
ncbi:MAG TPA: hypothetical protein PKK69_11240, partial [Ferruginibacter sp.]|nr:hypothetical protein [Ferruginibacter sp.]